MLCRENAKTYSSGNSHARACKGRADESVPQAALIRYTGQARVTVVGPISRRLYRFDGQGATVIVDGRDVAPLARIPILMRV